MRGERIQGRFTVLSEQGSIISGVTKELVRTVGNDIDWWFYDPENTVVDEIYDVGSSLSGGGVQWIGPISVPTVNATIDHGMTVQNERGFYNTDLISVTINMDVIKDGSDLLGSNSSTIPQLAGIETNPDRYLRDRIVYRGQVFSITQVFPRGLIVEDYTLITLRGEQVNAEELVNEPQFQSYANYSAFTSNLTTSHYSSSSYSIEADTGINASRTAAASINQTLTGSSLALTAGLTSDVLWSKRLFSTSPFTTSRTAEVQLNKNIRSTSIFTVGRSAEVQLDRAPTTSSAFGVIRTAVAQLDQLSSASLISTATRTAIARKNMLLDSSSAFTAGRTAVARSNQSLGTTPGFTASLTAAAEITP